MFVDVKTLSSLHCPLEDVLYGRIDSKVDFDFDDGNIMYTICFLRSKKKGFTSSYIIFELEHI